MLKQYIRDKKNNPIGILLAEKRNDLIWVGWSLCSRRDKFNKEKGMMIAKGRLESYYLPADYCRPTEFELRHPRSIQKDIDYIIDRAKRYFCKKEE